MCNANSMLSVECCILSVKYRAIRADWRPWTLRSAFFRPMIASLLSILGHRKAHEREEKCKAVLELNLTWDLHSTSFSNNTNRFGSKYNKKEKNRP